MNTRFFVVLAVVAALLVGGGLVGSATAQEATETPNATETANATETGTENESSVVEAAAEAVSQTETETEAEAETETENASDPVEAAAESVSQTEADTMEYTQPIRMDEYTRIVGWEFVDETVRIAVETERTQRITISDGAAGVGTAGATRVPKVTQRIFGGETTIVSMPVETAMGGHVVGVTIGGNTVRLSTEMSEGGDDPFRHFGGESGLFSGMLMALLMSVLAAGYVLWREDSGVIKA